MSGASIPARADYGGGCYRRAIVLDAEPGRVRGELADDFHHFAVEIRHDGRTVTAVDGEPVRVPWTTCPGALAPLRMLEGAPLATPLLDLARRSPAREQCTHWHVVACLAVTHAERFAQGGWASRRYDFAMPDRAERRTGPTLERDAEPVLAWTLRGMEIVAAGDEALVGTAVGDRAFRDVLGARAEANDAEWVEAAWVMQRSAFTGLGRQHDFEAMETAVEFGALVAGTCHTYAAERMHEGRRNRGTVREFGDPAARPLPGGRTRR